MDPAGIKGLAQALLPWYRAHHRALPWRDDPDPYKVWVSEIMLQQTRIEAVRPYYQRFMQALPDVAALAAADTDTLYKLWEGLGYYSRVRHLHQAAVQIMQAGGRMPDAYEQLLKLPGVGPYTAGAIASIAFGRRAAAVDGNVLRVLARLTGYEGDVLAPAGKKELSALAWELLPQRDAGTYNQAIMELGETVCLPGAAVRCGQCPAQALCEARRQGNAAALLVRGARPPRRMEPYTVLIVLSGQRVLLHRRPEKGLLAGMWELPPLPGHLSAAQAAQALRQMGIPAQPVRELPAARHLFTHVEWQMTGALLRAAPFVPPDGFCLATARQLEEDFALPGAYKAYQRLIPALLSDPA